MTLAREAMERAERVGAAEEVAIVEQLQRRECLLLQRNDASLRLGEVGLLGRLDRLEEGLTLTTRPYWFEA